MLTIKRVPTVLSNYQEDLCDSSGCGRNCLGQCCIPVSKLPLYAFKRNGLDASSPCSGIEGLEWSFLVTLLLGQWEDRMSRGLFCYDITTCETKVIPGKYGFIAQLNEGRHLKKRPTEFQVDRVLQPFDSKKFNFTKVGQEEALFRFEPSEDNNAHYYESSFVTSESKSPSIVAINVSPIEYGHVLLIPHVLDCLPQRIDRERFWLALNMAAEAANPFFRLGYNSLGAFATINHLHFQAYYLAAPFPVENAPTRRIPFIDGMQDNGVMVSRLCNYPVRGLVFEGGDTMQVFSDAVADACTCLQSNNIPYNVLISDSGKRVFLFPQCYAEKQALGEVSQELLDTQVNPAVWEISGHIVLKRKKDYQDASEDYAWRLLAEVSLSEERFQEVRSYIFEAVGMKEAYMDHDDDPEQDASLVELPTVSPSTAPYAQGCLVLQ